MYELDWISRRSYIRIVADNIRSVLTERKISQKEAARLCGLSTSTLNSILTYKTLPSLKTGLAIAQGLGVTMNELYNTWYTVD